MSYLSMRVRAFIALTLFFGMPIEVRSAVIIEGMTFGPDGNVYVASHYSAAVLVYAGPNAANAGSLLKTLSGVDHPVGLAFGPDNQLYASEQNLNQIVRWSGSAFSVFASGSRLATPIGLGFGPDGDLYVANYTGGNISEFQGPDGTSPGAYISTYATNIGNPGYISVVPEPATATIFSGVALAALLARVRRRDFKTRIGGLS